MPDMPNENRPHIGTLAEKSLHASLKEWLACPGDQIETVVDGYVIDIVRNETLIEIQTKRFSAIKRKLQALLPRHPVLLVHPLAQEKWIVRQTAAGNPIRRRKSPKRGQVEHIFNELIRIPDLITHPNLTLRVLLTKQEEIWRDDGQGSWRRQKWSVFDHRLLAVVDEISFQNAADWRSLLPIELPDPFTNRELATAVSCRLNLAQKMTYTLRHAGIIKVVGKRGNAFLFERS